VGDVGEGLVGQVGQQHLAQGPHDQEEDGADDRVDEEHTGAGQGDRLSRPHEQPGSDCPTDGDELDVAVGEVALELGLGVVVHHLVEVRPLRRRELGRRGGIGGRRREGHLVS